LRVVPTQPKPLLPVITALPQPQTQPRFGWRTS
jgi:hypothetical protein